jgi:hypothetical protein
MAPPIDQVGHLVVANSSAFVASDQRSRDGFRQSEYPHVASHRDLEPAVMTTPTVTEIRRNGNPVGARIELGRYTVPVGERVLYGQRVNGVVRVTDVPACGHGRAYLVEREPEQDGYDAPKALVSDYMDQAELLEDVPMAVSPLTGTRSEKLDGGER